MIDRIADRRSLIRGTLGLGSALLIPTAVGGAALAPSPEPVRAADPVRRDVFRPEKRLAFRNVHTNETFDARWYGPDGWDENGLTEIAHALRDWRTGEVRAIDRPLIAMLAGLRGKLDLDPAKPYDLISGYRSPLTNASLRERGGEHTGVATKSQHMLGKAADIAVPGVKLDRVRSAARAMGMGGVGYYPSDGFVHVDTGRVRFW